MQLTNLPENATHYVDSVYLKQLGDVWYYYCEYHEEWFQYRGDITKKRLIGEQVLNINKLLHIFSGYKSTLSFTCWFISINGYLNGERPCDLILKDPSRVHAAALEEVRSLKYLDYEGC